MKLDDGTEVFTADEMAEKIAEANAGLEANRDTISTEKKKAVRELKALKEQWGDLDADEVKAMLAERAEAETKKQKDKGDWEAREKALTDGFSKSDSEKDGRIEKLTNSLRKAIVTTELTQAISEAKGDPKYVLAHAERFVDVTETDDGFEAFVTDGNGNARVTDGQGTPMTFAELVETELITQYPRAFEGTGSSGSGATKSAVGGGGHKTIAAEDSSAFMSNLEGIASGEVEVR